MSKLDERMLYGSSIDWRMLSSYVGGGCRKCGRTKQMFLKQLIVFWSVDESIKEIIFEINILFLTKVYVHIFYSWY